MLVFLLGLTPEQRGEMIGEGLVKLAFTVFCVGWIVMRWINSPSRKDRAETAARELEKENSLSKSGPPRFNG
jgi:hypothetical protein